MEYSTGCTEQGKAEWELRGRILVKHYAAFVKI